MTPAAAPMRRSGASALRPRLVLRRCERCFTPTVLRADARERLCGSCSAGDRAIAQAMRSEPLVHRRLYAPRPERAAAHRAVAAR